MNSIPQSSQQLVELLKSKSLHISAAESCTAGLFSSSLASIPGASSVMEYGFVTYSAAAKTNLVSVKPDTIKNYTVYSGPIAAQMAIGAAQKSGAELGVGITGIAGPHAESQPAGTVYIAVANSEIPKCFRPPLSFSGSRPQYHPSKSRPCCHGSCHRRHHFHRPPAPLCLVLQSCHHPYRNRIQNPLILITI